MASYSVKNKAAGAGGATSMGLDAAKRARFEKSEVAYGKIPAAAYAATGDTLVFDQLPAKEIIHARFVTSELHEFEVFNKTDLSSALAWTFNSGTGTAPLDIHYVITYIRGTGNCKSTSNTERGEGPLLRIALTVT